MKKLPLPLAFSALLLLCQTGPGVQYYLDDMANPTWAPGPDVIVIDPAFPNSTTTCDMREIGITRITTTSSPGSAFSEEWRQSFSGKSAEELDAQFDQPDLVDWSLGGLYDECQSPFLTIVTVQSADFYSGYPKFDLTYTSNQGAHLKALAQRLAEKDAGQRLEAYQDTWQEELLFPSFFSAEIPESATYRLGLATLFRRVTFKPGHVTIQSKLEVQSMLLGEKAKRSTIALLQKNDQDPSFRFMPYTHDEFYADDLQPIFEKLKNVEKNPKHWAWAQYSRACAFAYRERSMFSLLMMERAAARRPAEQGMARALAIIGAFAFNQRYRHSEAVAVRPVLIRNLKKLLEEDPDDRKKVEGALLKTISRSLDPADWMSCEEIYESTPEELALARDVYEQMIPDERGEPYLALLADLRDFSAIETFLQNHGKSLSEKDRACYSLVANIGLGKIKAAQAISKYNQGKDWSTPYKTLLVSCNFSELNEFIRATPETVPKYAVSLCKIGLAIQAETENDPTPLGIFRRWWRAQRLADTEVAARMAYPPVNADPNLVGGHVMSMLYCSVWPFLMKGLKMKGDPAYGYCVESEEGWSLFLTGDQDGRLVIPAEYAFAAGHYILTLLERGEFRGAYQWLDWMGDDIEHLWEKATPRTPQNAVVAACSLVASGPDPQSVIPLLKMAYQQNTGARRDQIGLLLLQSARFSDELEELLQLDAINDHSPFARALAVYRCAFFGNCDELLGGATNKLVAQIIATGLTSGYDAALARYRKSGLRDESNEDACTAIAEIALLEDELPNVPEELMMHVSDWDQERYNAAKGIISYRGLERTREPWRKSDRLRAFSNDLDPVFFRTRSALATLAGFESYGLQERW